jgi:tripartite-type tricarboxylate transporter receptor subunit TctC
LIALAKSRPGQIFYSTSGRGTVGHLAAELLDSAAGIKLVHVPYKGAGPALIDLLAGTVQLQFASIPLLKDPENHRQLVANGAEPLGGTPEEHAAAIRSEIDKWRKVAKDAHIEPQ